MDGAVGDMTKPVAVDRDDAPAGVTQTRIETDYAHALSAQPRARTHTFNRAIASSDMSKLA